MSAPQVLNVGYEADCLSAIGRQRSDAVPPAARALAPPATDKVGIVPLYAHIAAAARTCR